MGAGSLTGRREKGEERRGEERRGEGVRKERLRGGSREGNKMSGREEMKGERSWNGTKGGGSGVGGAEGEPKRQEGGGEEPHHLETLERVSRATAPERYRGDATLRGSGGTPAPLLWPPARTGQASMSRLPLLAHTPLPRATRSMLHCAWQWCRWGGEGKVPGRSRKPLSVPTTFN